MKTINTFLITVFTILFTQITIANNTNTVVINDDMFTTTTVIDPCDAAASGNLDSDNDGISDICDLDDDNDGILDCDENGLNTSTTLNDLFSIAGSASFMNSNEIELTPDLNTQAGSAMSFGKIDFNYDFNFSIEINLGTKDIGADGIAIVFHNDPDGINTVGITGQGIGAWHIKNGISIEFDTYKNQDDISNDHTQIKNTRTWDGLTTMTDLGNIEDGNWYPVDFSWDASSKTLSYSFNGNVIANYTDDLITNIFNGESQVHFGFTASTGGQRNSQKIRLINDFCSYPFVLDTDNDNIPNHLDKDSDNDGCPDALEGGSNFTVTDINNQLTGGVDANGVPLIATATGQTIGSSLDNTIVSSICDTPYNPTSPAECFNVFVENHVNVTGGKTNGSLAAGGNLSINGNYIIASQDCGCFDVNGNEIGVLIDGNVNYDTGILSIKNATQYAKIGDSNGSSIWYQDPLNAPTPIRITPGNNYDSNSYIQLQGNAADFNASTSNNHVFEQNVLDFDLAFQQLRTNATSLSKASNNASLEDSSGNSISNTNLPNHVEAFLNSGTNYMNVTGADLKNVQIFNAQNHPEANKVLVININAPGTFNWNVWSKIGITDQDAPYIIYNFYNTTELIIEGSNTIYGTILAPFANITKTVNTANILGQVIGKSLTHSGGEIQCAAFTPSIKNAITTSVAPTAEFTLNVNPQCLVGNEYQFTNNSNTGGTAQPNNPISYAWNFGDGSTSTEMNPTKTYANSGTFTVTLTATNNAGSNTITKQVIVLENTDPIISETTTNNSTGSITKELTLTNSAEFSEFSWTLASEGSNLYQNQSTVSFTFTQPGTYEVTVNAIKNGCSSFATIALTISSNEVTTGNSGGLESESLGDAVTKRYVNRKKKSEPTVFVKSDEIIYNKTKLKSAQPYQGKGQTMLDMFPTELIAGNVSHVTSPTDILDYTIADEVLSVDFSINGNTKGVVLGVKTSDKVYNHTKASCDRLKGAEILSVQAVKLDGYNFLMQSIKQRNGVVEYAISFATAKNNNDSNYSIQTNWYVNNYTKFNDVYNFQVWSTNPTDTQKLVSDILANLKSYIPVIQTETQKIPKTYAAKIDREKSNLIIKLRSIKKAQNIEISMEELYSETANNLKHRYNPVNSETEQILKVDISDGYEYDGLVKVNGEIQDAFYHSDGNWGLDFDKKYTEIKEYFVSNDFDREYNDDELAINRNIKIKAVSEYDYLGIYKSLLPGNIPADYTAYKYLSFTAKGSGLMELGLVKSSIENWKSQYRIMVDLSEEEQTYYVPFDAFTSIGTSENITADDLTTLTFTFLPVEANTKELDLTISDVKFTKTAIEDQTIAKIETFENNFMAYPNPSQGNVNVLLYSKVDTNATVSLYDVTGKEIYSAPVQLLNGQNEITFNVKVKPGMLFLKVNSKQTNYGTSKIIFR